FQWDGLHWTSGMVLQRLLWVGVAIALTCLAALFFRRFDPAREAGQSRRKKQPAAPGPQTDLIPILGTVSARTSAHLTPLPRGLGSSFLALVRAELRVMLKGVSRWWYLVALGLWIASVLTPLEASRNILIAIWIWPLLLWSAMGTRESSCQTSAFIFSSPRSLQRQLPAVWLAGVIVALTTGSGVALRLAIAADFHGVFAWLAGALFIPTLALTLGVCSGTSKTFEAVYTFWWYTGPANHIPYVDFMGISASSGRPEFYFLLVAVLLVIAFAGRRARLAYA
ncbi:MAG TPA: hypothetical protein VEW69_01180, partial [Alphaproteobacteria bacterium]|nr:hypothetical protein [Alphaproteobacteria bacterium]